MVVAAADHSRHVTRSRSLQAIDRPRVQSNLQAGVMTVSLLWVLILCSQKVLSGTSIMPTSRAWVLLAQALLTVRMDYANAQCCGLLQV